MGQNENYRDMKKSKGKLMLADRKKKNLISIHEISCWHLSIYFGLHQQKIEQIILKPLNRFFER